MRSLASDYEGKAARLRQQAAAVQADLVATTGGTTFSLPQDSRPRTGARHGAHRPGADDGGEPEAHRAVLGHPDRVHARDRAATSRSPPSGADDVLLHLLLAQSAYQAQLVPIALKAYERVIKLAPDSAEAQQAKQQMQLLKLQAQAGRVPSG